MVRQAFAVFFLFLVACNAVGINDQIAQVAVLITSVSETTQTALETGAIDADKAQEIADYLQAAQNSITLARRELNEGRGDVAIFYLNAATAAAEQALLLRGME